MDNTTYPGSDTDVNETYENCDFHSIASNGLDFVDHWVNLTVEKEVRRGSQLREQKLRLYPHPQDEYDVAKIDFLRPPCAEKKTSYYRNRSPGRSKVKSGTCSPRSNSPFPKQKSSCRAYIPQRTYSRPNTPSIKTKYGKRCPMRIAELAVPTKRQCIDTWRTKYDILPAFMVERLKQQVMDQRPVVQIHEAINCFKRRKPKSIRCTKKASCVSSKAKQEMMNETRNLCVIFAKEIAQRLLTPQNIKLTPELENISKVVTDELTNIMCNRKKFDLDVATNKRIQKEVSEKITIWIALILEDTTYKLLEEDLRVKKYFERVDVKEERLVTLIEKLLQHEKSELEEEEGPVLDFLDDVVDKVVTICEPDEIDVDENDIFSEETSKASGSSEQDNRSVASPESVENNEFDTSTVITNITDTGDGTTNTGALQEVDKQTTEHTALEDTAEQSFDEHIRGELHKIVDSVTEEDNPAVEIDPNEDINNDNNLSSDNDVILDDPDQKIDSTEERSDIHRSPGNSELISQIKQASTLVEDEVFSNDAALPLVADEVFSNDAALTLVDDEVISNDAALTLVKDEVFNTTDDLEHDIEEPEPITETINTSADHESDADHLDEESLDDKNKKVKFTEIEMVDGESDRQLNDKKEEQNYKTNELLWHPSTDNLVFAPPNEHLLSDADETWPADLSSSPVLKPSASVSRSITSLGNIMEKDEKSLLEDEPRDVFHHIEDTPQIESEILEPKDTGDSRSAELLEIIQDLNHNEGKIAEHLTDVLKESTAVNNSEDVTDETASSLETIKRNDEKTIIDKTIEANIEEPETKVNLDSSTSPLKIPISDIIYKKEQKPIQKRTVEKEIKNLDSDTNVIYEAVQQKIRSSYAIAEPKHDYRVNAKTAPSWLHDHGKGEPSEDSFRVGKSTEKLNDSDISNWCKDMDRILANLDMWNSWIDSTCKNILYLKQRRETNKLFLSNAKRKDVRDWIILKKNIDKDAVLWTKLNQKAHERLKTYKRKAKYENPAHSGTLIINDNHNKEKVFKSLQEIDKLCLWMHRTIVSTEYCMLCDCKNKTKKGF